jgi:DNA-binding CsgD family transcriptional regulator
MGHLTHIRPLLCKPFIGRKQELRELKEILKRAAEGQAYLCLLSGEAGLGKTRLCHAFMQFCKEQQATILFGQAAPHDQMLPFGPFLDLFRRSYETFSETSTPFQQTLQATFSFLLHLAPELRSLFPTLQPPTHDLVSTSIQPQSVLFHQVLRGLQMLTKICQGPVVVVLEDLHWADETSLELLVFLAHRLGMNTPFREISTSLLILGTYRTEASPDSPVLQRLWSNLSVLRQVEHLQLTPFDRWEHWQCVNQILEQPIHEEFAHFLFEWDEGNPFFTEELLSVMLASGQLQGQPGSWLLPQGEKPPLPSSLTTAILERFQQLPSLDQDVLTYAVVLGRLFDFSLLTILCHIDEHKLVQVLRRAIRLQLISALESQPGRANHDQERYQFRHALTRQAIYEQMLLPERRLRHQRVAETIEAYLTKAGSDPSVPMLHVDNVTQLLVEHYHLAGLDARARPFALQEAQRASQVGAFREERFYLEVAQASLTEENPERLPLLERLGLVNTGVHDFSAALYWLTLAKEEYQRTGQTSQVLRVLSLMILPAWFLVSPVLPGLLTEIEIGIETAFASFDHIPRDMNLLEAASTFTAYQVVNGYYHRISRLAKRNNELFQLVTQPRKVGAIQFSHIAYSTARAHQHTMFVEESLTEIRHELRIAHQYSLPHVIMYAYRMLTEIMIFVGRLDEAKQVVDETIEYEQHSGILRVSNLIGWMYFFSGEQWEQGIESLSNRIQSLKRANILATVTIEGVILAHLLLARNDLLTAQTYLSQAQPILERMDENISLFWMKWGFAKLCMAQRKDNQAQEWYEGILALWRMTEDTLSIPPILLDGIIFYAQGGNLQQAKRWLSDLQQVTSMTDNPVGKAALLEAQGVIAARQKTLQPAIEALRQAVDAWGALKFRYHQALAAQHLAELLLQQATRKTLASKARQQAREEAEGLLQRASLVYEQLGIANRREAVQRLKAQTRLEAQRKRRGTMAAQHQAGELTSREVQILHLLAAGKTNKDIAVRLGISMGTVELHITHILTKLNCENRTQAVLYAVSQGWITPSL